MKLVFALVLLVLGLASAKPVEEEVLTELDDFDDDLDIDMEGMDMDQAREKLHLLHKMYDILEQIEGEQNGMDKRFIDSWFKKIKKTFTKVVHKVGDFFTDTYKKAKSKVEKLIHGINFEKVVDKLKDKIHSGMSVAACSKVCKTGASALLGPASSKAGYVCGPLCDGALAKLQKVVG